MCNYNKVPVAQLISTKLHFHDPQGTHEALQARLSHTVTKLNTCESRNEEEEKEEKKIWLAIDDQVLLKHLTSYCEVF